MFRRLLGVACAFVAVVPPARGDDPKPALEVSGVIAPIAHVRVSARGAGHVAATHVDVGDRVQKGELLAALDDAPQKAELRVAEANVKLAEARFEAEKVGSESEKLTCEAHVQKAKAELDRARKLGPALGDAEREAIEQGLRIAELALRAASAGADGKLAVARAEVEVTRAERERVLQAVHGSRLIAPMNGVVTHRLATVGQFVRPGDTLFEIADVSTLVAVVQVPERDLAKIAVGQPCRLTLVAGDKVIEGKVVSVAPVVDPAKATCTVTVALAAGDKPPRIGSSVKVAFLNTEK